MKLKKKEKYFKSDPEIHAHSRKTNYKLLLTFPCKNPKKIKRMLHVNESIPWIYLGQDMYKRRHIENDLGTGFKRINITKLHDKVAKDIKLEYVHWIDSLNRRYGNKLEWWFESVSSRDNYCTNLFQYSCYLEILERLRDTQHHRPALIVLESLGLAKAIQKWGKKKDIYVEIIYKPHLMLRNLHKYLIVLLRWGKFAVILLFRWIAAFVTRQKYEHKDLNVNPSVIVDTFIHNNSLSTSGLFNDRHFPYLHEYLYKKGVHVLVHSVLYGFRFNYFSIYERMRKSNTLFIIAEDFLRFSDYISVLAYPLKVLGQKIESSSFRSYDISDILMEELRERSLTSGFLAVLIYRLFLRLGKEGLKPKQVISWYENQIIDKALIAGVRKAFPKVKIIGAQMFIHYPNWLNLYPSQSEVESKVAPHILVETSQYQCHVAQSFTKSIPCKPAAALRYAHVFKDENLHSYEKEQKTQSILVLLPFDIDEAIELLETLKNGLNKIRKDKRILIKVHPIYNSKELVQAFGEDNWPNRYEIFQGNLPDVLKQASVVISSTSSSIVEAAAKGIPVIFLGRQTVLNQNILFNLNMDITTECFSVSELVMAINKYLDLSSVDIKAYREMGKRIRDLFFTPVNEKTMAPFLGIEDDS